MNLLESALTWLHVVANLVWIGSILSVGVVLTSSDPASAVRGELGLRLYRGLAVPAFVVSFVCGASRLLMHTSYYLVEHHWMHPKLLVAAVVIGLHHVIGARARKLARGTVPEAGPTGMLCAVLAVMAALAAFFAIFRIPA